MRWLLLVLLQGCVGQTYGAAGNGRIPTKPPGAPYPNWEHLCITVSSSNLTEALNKAGSEGWELVGVDAGGIACFKRPIYPKSS